MELQPASTNPLITNLRLQDDVAILDLRGEIDAFADEILDAAYEQAAATCPQCLLLNFGGVDYINSTGIALIVSILAQTRRDHIRLITCSLSEHYQELFRITRISDFVQVFPDESSALHAA